MFQFRPLKHRHATKKRKTRFYFSIYRPFPLSTTRGVAFKALSTRYTGATKKKKRKRKEKERKGKERKGKKGRNAINGRGRGCARTTRVSIGKTRSWKRNFHARDIDCRSADLTLDIPGKYPVNLLPITELRNGSMELPSRRRIQQEFTSKIKKEKGKKERKKQEKKTRRGGRKNMEKSC